MYYLFIFFKYKFRSLKSLKCGAYKMLETVSTQPAAQYFSDPHRIQASGYSVLKLLDVSLLQHT